MTVYVVRKISDGFYFEDFVSERSASWGACEDFATEYPVYHKAYSVCNILNKNYGYKVAKVEKIEK